MTLKRLAYKYRIRPNGRQAQLLARTFGCCRFLYNQYVEWNNAAYNEWKAGGCKKGSYPVMPLEATFKEGSEFLKEVDSTTLMNVRRHFANAVKAFTASCCGKRKGRKVKAPTFHKKGKCRDSFTSSRVGANIRLNGDMLHLPKLGDVRLVLHRELPQDARILSVTVSREKDYSFYASVLFETDLSAPTPRAEGKPVEEQRVVGLDMSLTHFYVSSDEELDATRTKYVKRFREAEKKVKRLNRQHSRKQLVPTGEVRFSKKWQKDVPIKEPSRNREKARVRLAKAHRRAANRRLDFICQEAARLSKAYDVIVVEDIDMQAMARSLRLGKSVNDLGWGAFINRLQWACEKNGCTLVKADRWFASSKTCSACGHKNDGLTLSDREWTCPHCGAHHDRDRNAALNLRAWYYTNILAVTALPLERREVTPLESSPLPMGPSALGQAFTLKEETSPSCEPFEGSPLLGEAKWG